MGWGVSYVVGGCNVVAWAGVGAKADKISLSVVHVEESPGVRALTEVACQNTNLPLK